MLDDDAFTRFANTIEEENRRERNRTSFEREEVKWVGCETGTPLIFRAVGGPPGSNIDPYTARIVTIAWVNDDDGRRVRIIRPNSMDDPGYIINRIIARVTSPRWINGEKVYPVQKEFPEIYNQIEKNGLDTSDKRYNFDKGWKGKEVIIMNIIDRSDMEWHRENKHTKLLAKSVIKNKEGGEFIDEGVSSFSVNPRLAHLFRSYGSWEGYDIGITKTGNKDLAYNIVNASNSPREINPPSLQQYISTEPHLTEEEESWERYDLEKMFKVTSATKILNRLGKTIKRIDFALETEFYSELEELAKKEREEWNKEQNETPSYTSPTAEEEFVENKEIEVPEITPVRERRVVRPEAKPVVKGDIPPYLDELIPEVRAQFVEGHKNSDGSWDLKWNAPVETLLSCPNCSAISPESANRCLVCNTNFLADEEEVPF